MAAHKDAQPPILFALVHIPLPHGGPGVTTFLCLCIFTAILYLRAVHPSSRVPFRSHNDAAHSYHIEWGKFMFCNHVDYSFQFIFSSQLKLLFITLTYTIAVNIL